MTKTVSWIMKVRAKYPDADVVWLTYDDGKKAQIFSEGLGTGIGDKCLSGWFRSEREAWEDAAKRLGEVNPEREAFEDRLREDRYDGVTRLVFADWLDEHDFPEEADWQRKWTPEWQRAYDEAGVFFVKFANNAGATVEEVLEAAKKFVETGETSQVGYSLGLGATNLWRPEYEDPDIPRETDEVTPTEFWKHYTVYTGKEAPASKGEPFHCCY